MVSGSGRVTVSSRRLCGRIVACELDAAVLKPGRETVARFGKRARLQTIHVADGRGSVLEPS